MSCLLPICVSSLWTQGRETPPEKTDHSRHQCFSDRSPHLSTMEMEQEKVNMSKALSADSGSYRCSACHGDEDWGSKHPIRGRAKSRSLSASPALASAKEFRRTRSLHGPCPVTTFGPKACVLQNPQTIMHIQDPASQRLTWNKSPKSVLVIKKMRDASLLQPFKELCTYLMEENNMIVYVEKKVLEDPAMVSDDNFGAVKKKFCTFREDYDDISNQIDFIICLGGDGTLLYASSLFQGSVPPVMAFHLGSLGFLTPFNFENFQSQVTQVIQGNAAVVLRSRLKVRVVKELRGKKMTMPNGISENGVLAADLDTEVGKQVMQYQIMLSPEARNTAWVSFDGRKRQEIRHGDSISITTSCYPLPSICVRDPVSDWFESLAQCLHWNVRKKQAHFTEEEEEEEEEEVEEGEGEG
ncbi:NAD kinase isoform X3 [Vulpes vulpes]|uniref:NAD(+) kinase n=2 Tax=Vulpes vulpes TaxID=9627 RepID=A0A3Q7SLS6_VULVU|nr:NAD kinase isoform X2 [Vulpes vulpes]